MSNNFLQLQSDFFTELSRKGRSFNTLKNYKTDLECFNSYIFSLNPNFDVHDFSLREMNRYGEFLQDKYNSDNSRRRRVQALRIFFDYLVEKDIVKENPVRSVPTSPKFVDIPRPSSLIHIKTVWTYELRRGVDSEALTKLTSLRNQLVILLVYSAGLKVSDLAGLKKEHIFIDNRSARVMVIPAKRDPYTVPLPFVAVKLLKIYLPLLEQYKKDVGPNFNEVLFNANGFKIINGGLSPRGLELLFADYRKKLNVEITAKSLRQACIFKWINQDKKDNQIKEWLGLAPSYSLKPYKNFIQEYKYNDTFLHDIFELYS